MFTTDKKRTNANSSISLATNISVYLGDAKDVLSRLESDCYQACITSPPYWGLRDYEIDGQIGAEEVLDDYITNLVQIFREVYRVLTPDGTLWLNIGDSYTSGGRTWRAPDKKNPARAMTYRPATPAGLKPKDLIGVPWRVAFALQQDGWYLRSDIVWHKPNCQPESVKDRPTRAHEYLFLLSKSENYYYNYEAIQEISTGGKASKNRRSVWSINTQPFNGAHFAVFPPELVELCMLAASVPGSSILDPFFGSGTVGQVCVQLNRICTGIELNPDYLLVAKERLSSLQGRLWA